MRRIACLLVPDLPLQAALRAEPELEGAPLVISSGPGSRAEVLVASPAARARGVRARRTLPQARALCPDLQIRVASPVLEQAARAALLDVALSLAPRAELTERGSGLFACEASVSVDATGIGALHEHEGAFASKLHAHAERAGIRGVVGLASSRSIARLVARHLAHLVSDPREGTATRILAPERELAFLAPLPIELLDPDDRTAQALTRFGIHRIHDLLRLSRRDLAARLGPELLALVARARGEEDEPPLRTPRERRLEEGVDLEAAIDRLEPLTFVLRGLVSRLVQRLELRALGCREIELGMRLESGVHEHRRIATASPTRDPRTWLRSIRLVLESKPPGAAVDSVVIGCEGVPLRRDQLDLFGPRGPDPTRLDQTLAELGALCGTERVGSPTLVDDHRPDAFALRPLPERRADLRGEGRASTEGARGPRLTLRMIRPPQPAEVRIEGGRPVFVRSAIGQGEISAAAGPWRTTGHWWSESTHFVFDHYDVQTSDGLVCRLCFDWRKKRWQIDGVYD